MLTMVRIRIDPCYAALSLDLQVYCTTTLFYMKYYFLVAFLFSTVRAFTQHSAIITYDVKYHGKDIPDGRMKLFIDGGHARLHRVNNPNAKEQIYLDYTTNRTMQVLSLQNNAHVTQVKDFKDYEQPELLPDTAILQLISAPMATVLINGGS